MRSIEGALRVLILAVLTMSVSFVTVGKAGATIYTAGSEMSGDRVVPPTGSPGLGFAALTVNTADGTIGFVISYSGLLGDVTAIDIHGPVNDPVTENGPVLISFPVANPANGSIVVTPVEASYVCGASYIDIHTTAFPDGEVRGFFFCEPLAADPTTWGAIKGLFR